MLMKMPELLLSNDDYKKLSALIASQPEAIVAGLEEEIARAKVLPAQDFPSDVVAMGSQVKVRDLGSGAEFSYRLVYPHEANVGEGRISILAPLGVALIGLQVNEEYEFVAPDERVRQFRVLSITRENL